MEIKTKFNIGDDIWFMSNNKPVKHRIQGIIIQIRETGSISISYTPVNMPEVGEYRCFKTKKELINSL